MVKNPSASKGARLNILHYSHVSILLRFILPLVCFDPPLNPFVPNIQRGMVQVVIAREAIGHYRRAESRQQARERAISKD